MNSHVKLALSLAFVCVAVSFAGSVPTKSWEIIYNGPNGSGIEPEDLAIDSYGNVYVVGNSIAPLKSGVPKWKNQRTGNTKCILVKYNANKKLVWTREYCHKKDADNYGKVIALGKEGSVYIGGYYMTAKGSLSPFVLKYDPSGIVKWDKGFDGSLEKMDVDEASNVYISGLETENSIRKYCTTKFNSEGSQLWQRKGNPGNRLSWFRDQAVDGSGNVFAAGETGVIKYDSAGNDVWTVKDVTKAIDIDSDDNLLLTGPVHKSGKSRFFAITKYNSAGKSVWTTDFRGGKYESDAVLLLECGALGNIYVSGTIKGAEENVDVAIAKYDAATGRELWLVRYNDDMLNGMDIPTCMRVDKHGNVHIVVKSSNACLMILKYGPDGKLIWKQRYDLRRAKRSPKDFEIDDNGNIFVLCDDISSNKEMLLLKYSQKPENLSPAGGKIKVISEQQQAFAKRMFEQISRMYDLLGGKDMPENSLSVVPELFEMEIYKKWGLGDKRDFSRKEKYYLMQLPMVEQTWQMYSGIDTAKLTADEKSFVKKNHVKYGKGLINLRKETVKEKRTLSQQQEIWFDLIKAVTGTDELDDRGLILVYKMTPR